MQNANANPYLEISRAGTTGIIIEYEEIYDEELGYNITVEKSRTEVKKKVF